MNKLILDTLKDINIPITFQVYNGNETTYGTFFTYLEQGEKYADDNEVLTGYYVQLDIFSKTNYEPIVINVKDRMLNAGFRRTYETELYEDDTKYFHKVLRFSYAKNNKE